MATTAPAAADKLPPPPLTRSCGTMPVHERLLRSDPEYARLRIVSENHHFNFRAMGGVNARTGVTVIPVVVHVVFKLPAQNVSDAQIASQIAVLNRDFRKTNGDIASIPQPFKALAADARIEFVMADKDPNGAATTGITRTQTASDSFSDDDKVKSAATGGANAWPRDKYMNLWVCQLGNGLLGYAQFPGGAAATDGVVILHSGFGTVGTAAVPFNLGRSATHEIGHWLNLRHIWGDDGGGCNGDDFINDTPNQADHNFGKPAFPHLSCNNGPNGDLFMNYMDYTDDDSMFMFSAGQVQRIQACLDGDRASIGTQKPTLAAVDQIGPSLKFIDDGGTLKFRDDGPSLKFRDDGPSLKFRDDGPSLKFRDDGPSLKFRDDGPSLKFRDDPSTLKFRDDVKMPIHDKLPPSDIATGFGGDVGGLPHGGGDPGPLIGGGHRGQGGVPFVLSTPHHSMAWTQSFPQAAHAEAQALEQQIAEYEAALGEFVQLEAAGQLSPEMHAQAQATEEEYAMLVAEYQRMGGG